MDEATQNAITTMTEIIAGTALAAGAVALTGMVLDEIIVPTNISGSDIAGDVEMHPTVTKTILSESKVAGDSTKGNISVDEVNAQKGEVKASNLDATAEDGEATALEDGASAVRTKEGASDTETKALKMT